MTATVYLVVALLGIIIGTVIWEVDTLRRKIAELERDVERLTRGELARRR